MVRLLFAIIILFSFGGCPQRAQITADQSDQISAAVVAKITPEIKTTIATEIKTKVEAEFKMAIGGIIDQSSNTTFNEVKPWLWAGGIVMGLTILATLWIRLEQNRSSDRLDEQLITLAKESKCRYRENSV